MDGTLVVNKHPTTRPLKVLLADGRQVMSTHMSDISINALAGHIIPDLSIALLFGIRVLTEAGCKVTFTQDECVVRYNKKIILRGEEYPSTNLWTLLLGSQGMTFQHANCILPSAAPVVADAHAHPALHAYGTHQSKQHLFCTPIFVQPTNFYPAKSHSTRVPQRVPKPHCQGNHKISQFEPSNSKGPHETTQKRHPQYAAPPK